MKTTVMLVAAAALALAACNRTDTTPAGTRGAVGNPDQTADVRSSSVPPITPSTTATTPPPLPAPPQLPHGAGDATPPGLAGGSSAQSPSSPDVGAQSTAASQPMSTLTPHEESTQMPKAGQANNYSDTAIEAARGRPSSGQGQPGQEQSGKQ
jgi:hypothetical protein